MSATARCGGFLPPRASASKKIVHASEQERPDVAEARLAWREDQPGLDPARLVFIDETGTTTNMARLRGRARRGHRVVGRVPWGHWKTMTFVAGLRHDAVTAPFVIDRAMTGAIFIEYLRQCLLPALSPDLNPIEQAFSKLKAHLRKAQERSLDTLWQRIGKLLDLFQPSECANFFVNSGYARV